MLVVELTNRISSVKWNCMCDVCDLKCSNLSGIITWLPLRVATSLADHLALLRGHLQRWYRADLGVEQRALRQGEVWTSAARLLVVLVMGCTCKCTWQKPPSRTRMHTHIPSTPFHHSLTAVHPFSPSPCL